MSRHDPIVTFCQLRDHAREAMAMVAGRSRSELATDRMLNLSLTRLLEIIGEAARRLPEEERGKLPDVPWPRLVGLRNRLIHGYDDINLSIVWRVATEDLPILLRALEQLPLPE